jgi:hypothetical protein
MAGRHHRPALDIDAADEGDSPGPPASTSQLFWWWQ